MWWDIFLLRFNLLRFADNTESWKEHLVEASDETCHGAVQWMSRFQADGNACILMALQVSKQCSTFWRGYHVLW